jgi:hypothetical protein
MIFPLQLSDVQGFSHFNGQKNFRAWTLWVKSRRMLKKNDFGNSWQVWSLLRSFQTKNLCGGTGRVWG